MDGMTTEEHMLMMMVYYKQQQAIRILLDMLISREVLTADDEAAFQFAQTLNDGSSAAILEQTWEKYLELARIAGVQVPFEKPPEPPYTWPQK